MALSKVFYYTYRAGGEKCEHEVWVSVRHAPLTWGETRVSVPTDYFETGSEFRVALDLSSLF